MISIKSPCKCQRKVDSKRKEFRRPFLKLRVKAKSRKQIQRKLSPKSRKNGYIRIKNGIKNAAQSELGAKTASKKKAEMRSILNVIVAAANKSKEG